MNYPQTNSRTENIGLRELPPGERPREKMALLGPSQLSDRELLAILIGSGSKKEDALAMATRLLPCIDATNGRPDAQTLSSLSGVGPARAARISAAFELVRRRIRPEGTSVRNPEQAYSLVRHFSNRMQEHFICLTLNGGGELIKNRVISIGLVDRTPVHPREVFVSAILDRASSIIVAHNHPSGKLEPSPEDLQITGQLEEAGELMGIRLLDHLIFTKNGYLSLREEGHLQNS